MAWPEARMKWHQHGMALAAEADSNDYPRISFGDEQRLLRIVVVVIHHMLGIPGEAGYTSGFGVVDQPPAVTAQSPPQLQSVQPLALRQATECLAE